MASASRTPLEHNAVRSVACATPEMCRAGRPDREQTDALSPGSDAQRAAVVRQRPGSGNNRRTPDLAPSSSARGQDDNRHHE